MARADSNHSTRRGFVSLAAVAATAILSQPKPAFAAADDSALLKLEEEIFEQYEQAHSLDDEMIRLAHVWQGEWCRLSDEIHEGRSSLTEKDAWDLVGEMPESKEHNRLTKVQNPLFDRLDVLTNRLFAMPAHTAEGRRAKVAVLLTCVMGHEWTAVDKETDYAERIARNLLIELIGGEPAKMLAKQFA